MNDRGVNLWLRVKISCGNFLDKFWFPIYFDRKRKNTFFTVLCNDPLGYFFLDNKGY